MKKIYILLFLAYMPSLFAKAGNGDSIFNMQYVHTLHITFPYPNFYDSLLNTNVTDVYLPVDIDFNGELFTNVGIKVKGNSSFNNPSQKKSFKIDFNVLTPGQDIHGLKKLNFNNCFKDPSFIREKITNDFLLAHDIPAPRTTYCNVYMNGQLWGLYTILEEIDDEFCKHWFDNNERNLFKGDPHGDLRWKGSSTQSLYETEYELKNNSSSNNWSDLISMIDVINNSSASNFQTALDAKLNTAMFVKQWAVMNMFSSLDSYIGSGHNYYIYHDSINDKFQWIAWDNNESFGSFKNSLTSTQLKNLDIYYLSNPTGKPLCNNMLSNAYYKALYENTYCELKQDFTNSYFNPLIDSIKNKIQSSVYADPKKFYTNTKFDSSFNYDIVLTGPGGITVFGIKSFITERSVAINNIFSTNSIFCWPSEIAETKKEDLQITLFPNPLKDMITVRANFPLTEIHISDISGRCMIARKSPASLSESFDLSNFPPGLYFVEINHQKSYKILK